MSAVGSHYTGQRSPRWAVAEGFQVVKRGQPYLDRLRLIQTPAFSLYLHRIHTPDQDRDPHDHPWWFASLVLSGGYVEDIYGGNPGYHRFITTRPRGRWSLGTMRRDRAHRIVSVDGVLWTLVLTGPRRATWGFWTASGWTDWRDYDDNAEGRGR